MKGKPAVSLRCAECGAWSGEVYQALDTDGPILSYYAPANFDRIELGTDLAVGATVSTLLPFRQRTDRRMRASTEFFLLLDVPSVLDGYELEHRDPANEYRSDPRRLVSVLPIDGNEMVEIEVGRTWRSTHEEYFILPDKLEVVCGNERHLHLVVDRATLRSRWADYRATGRRTKLTLREGTALPR